MERTVEVAGTKVVEVSGQVIYVRDQPVLRMILDKSSDLLIDGRRHWKVGKTWYKQVTIEEILE